MTMATTTRPSEGAPPTDVMPPHVDDNDNNEISRNTSSQRPVEGVQENNEESGHAANDGKINGRSKGKIAVIMTALCLALFLAALDATIVTTALPTISEHFHSAAGYTWIGSAFLLANAASTPSWAKVSDIFGRKPMLLAANVSCPRIETVAGCGTALRC